MRALAYAIPFFWGLLAASVVIAEAPGTNNGARQVVERLHDALLEVMQRADELGFAGRERRLAPVIATSFDFSAISGVVLGRAQWGALKGEQRSLMEDTFRQLTVATYADRFDGYSGEQFTTVSQRALKRGRVLVQSELKEADGNVVRLDYVLHPIEGDGWRIINILADGVSDLSVKRAEYSSILREEGFKQLIAKLKEQIAELGGN